MYMTPLNDKFLISINKVLFLSERLKSKYYNKKLETN